MIAKALEERLDWKDERHRAPQPSQRDTALAHSGKVMFELHFWEAGTCRSLL